MSEPANKKRVRLLLDADVDESLIIREQSLGFDVGNFIVNEVINEKWCDDCDFVVVVPLDEEPLLDAVASVRVVEVGMPEHDGEMLALPTGRAYALLNGELTEIRKLAANLLDDIDIVIPKGGA